MDYRIVATLGPVSSREAVWKDMVSAGAGSFRLNTSHLAADSLMHWIERVGGFIASSGRDLGLVLDLQGGKWRLGEFTPFVLEPGAVVTFRLARSSSVPGVLPVPHADFFKSAASSGREIVLNDAKSVLVWETAGPRAISARVVRGGAISPRKGVTHASCGFRSEELSGRDRAILDRTRGLPFISYAISYVKDEAEMSRYRELFGPGQGLIAKLERESAVEEAEGIARHVDELWLCRGDLGAEMGLESMARAAHRFSGLVRGLPVPVMLAGQVLEHMVASPTPTRSEVCCIHDALASGFRGLVLSDETAVGSHPVEACRAAALFRG